MSNLQTPSDDYKIPSDNYKVLLKEFAISLLDDDHGIKIEACSLLHDVLKAYDLEYIMDAIKVQNDRAFLQIDVVPVMRQIN